MTQIATNSQNDVNSFRESLGDFAQVADLSAKGAKYIRDSLLGTLVKVDHILFKSNAYSTVLNEDASKEFPDHKHCRMGQWYLGIGQERFGNTTAFKKMDAPHATVHDSVAKNMVFVKEGSVLKANHPEIIVQNFRQMEDASHELFKDLDMMIKEYEETR
ncbi:MAG: CZB domain-containing protein [Hydrogenimonas sp.]|nr:CZB domain-containing protein [Hydrogenimonas sp.]